MRYEIGQVSRIGNRSLNQDRCCIVKSNRAVLLMVADGMGGHAGGEQAAQITIQSCARTFQSAAKPIVDAGAFLQQCIGQAHHMVYEFGRRQEPRITPRTTCVIALVQNGNVYWAHVGDSRLYLFRDGRAVQHTRDHSYVQRLHDEGLLFDWDLETHPLRNIVTRCVGGESSAPQVTLSPEITLLRNDVILLCSDGLWGAVEQQRLGLMLAEKSSLSDQVQNMALRAEHESAPRSDNISVAALRWLSGPTGSNHSSVSHTGVASHDDKLAAAIDYINQAYQEFEEELKKG